MPGTGGVLEGRVCAAASCRASAVHPSTHADVELAAATRPSPCHWTARRTTNASNPSTTIELMAREPVSLFKCGIIGYVICV